MCGKNLRPLQHNWLNGSWSHGLHEKEMASIVPILYLVWRLARSDGLYTCALASITHAKLPIEDSTFETNKEIKSIKDKIALLPGNCAPISWLLLGDNVVLPLSMSTLAIPNQDQGKNHLCTS